MVVASVPFLSASQQLLCNLQISSSGHWRVDQWLPVMCTCRVLKACSSVTRCIRTQSVCTCVWTFGYCVHMVPFVYLHTRTSIHMRAHTHRKIHLQWNYFSLNTSGMPTSYFTLIKQIITKGFEKPKRQLKTINLNNACIVASVLFNQTRAGVCLTSCLKKH